MVSTKFIVEIYLLVETLLIKFRWKLDRKCVVWNFLSIYFNWHNYPKSATTLMDGYVTQTL